jgi:hypothetical protein
MNRTDCGNVRREIEQAAKDEILAAPARDHLNNCAACATFGNEQQKLKDMVASLGSIEAPADFDFKLRARLATSRSSQRDLFSGNGFGMRSVVFATLVLLLGFVLVLMNVRLRSNVSMPVAQAPGSQKNSEAVPEKKNESRDETSGAEVAGTSSTSDPTSIDVQSDSVNRNLSKRSGSSAPQYVARNGRVKATDLSATAAPVLRPERELGPSVFALGTSYQSLKVSVDDGRGSSRIISLPTVTFGSSRVLARNPAPLMVSTRDSW